MYLFGLIYIILIVIIIALSQYYKKLTKDKTFLEGFDQRLQNNTVLGSYDIYTGSYENTVSQNDKLETRLQNNNYGEYYNTLYTNFTNLNAATGLLEDEINRRSFNLRQKIDGLKTTLYNDANFISTNRDGIIQRNNTISDRNLTVSNTPTIPNGFTTTIINGNPGNMTQYRSGYQNTIFRLNILGSLSGGAVWGTDVYTDDSAISMSAVHAGVLTNGQRGDVFIQMVGPRSSYTGTNRNGVRTHNYGSWPGSYQFLRSDNNINTTLNNTINRQLQPSVSSYISALPQNQQVNTRINNIYNQGLNVTNARINGMNITLQQALQQNVNDAINNKQRSLPNTDLSNNRGILVRIFNNITTVPNNTHPINLRSLGTLEREYIVPNINYYMTTPMMPFFSPDLTRNRMFEFIGNILIPQHANMTEFQLETSAGSRFQVLNNNGSSVILVIDALTRNRPPVDMTSAFNAGAGTRFPFRLLAYEGGDNYIMLKWRINQQGTFNAIPRENLFLPNLLHF